MGKTDELIKSISYDQREILNNILKLHVPEGKIDCDVTYSTGQFYRYGIVPEPLMKFDINPSCAGVKKADCRNLPLADSSINCMVIDPPFLATKGKSLNENTGGNVMLRRFGYYESDKELYQLYIDSIAEAYRVLKPHGILIFKCQDRTSRKKQYMSHVFIINEAEKAGFAVKDLFILLAKRRITADWQVRNQKTARKYHSYTIVFEKDGYKPVYVE